MEDSGLDIIVLKQYWLISLRMARNHNMQVSAKMGINPNFLLVEIKKRFWQSPLEPSLYPLCIFKNDCYRFHTQTCGSWLYMTGGD